jgi:2-iminobutanoate/2-iminopropanoate deaminase
MSRQSVSSSGAPKAIGPYSHAVWTGNLLYCSGQTPIDPATGQLVEGDIGQQTKQAFNNLAAVLQDAGLSMDDVIKVNVYLTSMENFSGMNEVYQSVFNPPYPARTTIAVAELPLNAIVEIELVAQKNK